MSETIDINKITAQKAGCRRNPENVSGRLLWNKIMGIKIGDKITISSGDDKAIEDIVNTQTYTITGFGKSSYYLDLTRDSSTTGNGSMSGFRLSGR